MISAHVMTPGTTSRRRWRRGARSVISVGAPAPADESGMAKRAGKTAAWGTPAAWGTAVSCVRPNSSATSSVDWALTYGSARGDPLYVGRGSGVTAVGASLGAASATLIHRRQPVTVLWQPSPDRVEIAIIDHPGDRAHLARSDRPMVDFDHRAHLDAGPAEDHL